MPRLRDAFVDAFFAACRAGERYFRYETRGFEHIAGAPASLIVGYHGMPWPYDVFFLGRRIRRELGYTPRSIWLSTWRKIPIVSFGVDALGGSCGEPDEEVMRRLRERGEHLVLIPGGSREALRTVRDRYTIDWGDRRGYVRLADRYGLSIIPVACTGTDVAYIGLNNGYRLSKRIFGHGRVPLWIAVGMGGLWPIAPPWPVKIRQRIGAPIDLAPIKAAARSEGEFLEAAHARVAGAMQALLDELRSGSYRRSLSHPRRLKPANC